MKTPKKQYNSINNYYNHTSVAHDYQPQYEYNPKPLVNRRIKKIKKEKYVKVEQNLKVFSLKFYATLAIITTFIIAAVFIDALIIQKRFDIDALSSTLKEINENNKNLETELAKNLDLEYVEYIATTELGMQKPTSNQIIHINIPKESYSEKGQVYEEDTFLLKIVNLFKN